MYEGRLTCACGCGEEIVWKSHHKRFGIPAYINHHHAQGMWTTDLRNKGSYRMRGNTFGLGYRHSDETKKLISLVHKGKTVSEETREKMRLSKLGVKTGPFTEEHKQKLSESNKSESNRGKHNSDEVRAKLRKSWQSEGRKKRLREFNLNRKGPYQNTSIEKKIQEGLRKSNVDYRVGINILGTPDIFIKPNICIFCDGDYWHHRKGCLEYDERVTRGLENDGYVVLRFWEHEINSNIDMCINSITGVLSL